MGTHMGTHETGGGTGGKGQAGPDFSSFPVEPLRASATRSSDSRSRESNKRRRILRPGGGWAGSPELVKHDSPRFPGGAGT